MTFIKEKINTDGYKLCHEVFKKWWYKRYWTSICSPGDTFIMKFRHWYDNESPGSWMYCIIEMETIDDPEKIVFEWDFDEGQNNYEIAGFVSIKTLAQKWEDWKL